MYSQTYFSSTLDRELSTTSTSTVYRAKFEDGSFREYTLANATSSWTVVDKFGTTYTFGTSSAARYVDTTDSSRVFRWMLQHVQDTNGNTMTFGYTKDGDVSNASPSYPSSITYTVNGTSTAPFEVSFTLENRPENIRSYKHGFEITTRKRVSDISIKFNGAEVHHYDLAYTTGHNSVRSLLQTVTESGVGDSGTVQIPPIKFTYQEEAISLATSTTAIAPPDIVDSSNNDKGFRVFNFSGNLGSSLFRFASNSPAKRYQSPDWDENNLPTNYPLLVDTSNKGRGGGIADVNGDGYLDAILSKEDVYQEVYIFTPSNSFTLATSSTLSNIPYLLDSDGNDLGIRFGDFNGDGYADYIQGQEGGSHLIFLNEANGAGWNSGLSFTATSSHNFVDSSGNDNGARVLVVNGDGLDDIAKRKPTDSAAVVLLNKGDGTTWYEIITSSFGDITGASGEDIGIRVVDINGDGLQDLIKAYERK
jgi:hypothetical protein